MIIQFSKTASVDKYCEVKYNCWLIEQTVNTCPVTGQTDKYVGPVQT